MKKFIDPYEVRALFNYDKETGILTHSFSRRGAKRGKEAGTIDKSGTKNSVKLYRKVSVDYKLFYAHRIIWVMQTGEQPLEVDHIDGNGLNNKWENLRNVSHSVNGRNQKLFTTNTSGTAGVSFLKNSGRWRARIMVDDKAISLGNFIDKDQAIEARKQAELKYNL